MRDLSAWQLRMSSGRHRMSSDPIALQHHAGLLRFRWFRHFRRYVGRRSCYDASTQLTFTVGEYVSLGYYEKEDLVAVVDYLRGTDSVSRIGLWGRRFMDLSVCSE